MKRILSVDGGGIKGVFPAAFLSELETHASPIGRYFDLICGTSTGGIIALGLAAGLSATEVLEFYRAHSSEIFPRPRRRRNGIPPARESPRACPRTHPGHACRCNGCRGASDTWT